MCRTDLMLCDTYCGFAGKDQSAWPFTGLKCLPWIKNKKKAQQASFFNLR